MALKRPESVLVVIYDAASRVLLLQRDDDSEFWQSVTGTIEAGEIPVQTARREVWEETGIKLASHSGALVDCRHANQYPIRKRWRYRYPPGTVYNTEYVFCCEVSSTQAIVLSEHLSYEWLSKRDAMEKVWSYTNREAIERFVPEAQPDAKEMA